MRFNHIFTAGLVVLVGFAHHASSTGFGVNAHIPSNAVSDRIEAAGIEWVRIDVLWSFIEPERDVYDWSIYDALVDRLESRGLRIYAGLGATPEWATSGPGFSGVPDDPDDWREFCYLAALRYSGRIHAWGLWNEPNLDRFWEGTRQQYIDTILLPGAQAIRLGDPSTLVCAPDLAHLGSANWEDWLKATIRVAKDQLDVVTHHVYPSNGFASEVTYDLETGGPFPFSPPSVEEVLRDAGWWRRPFWLAETGVQSLRWGETRQANFVGTLLDQWFAPSRGHRSWVDNIFFYEMNDSPDPSLYTFGLLHGPPALIPKQAYEVYSQSILDAVVDDAEIVDFEVPRFFRFGERRKATIKLRNAGTTDWSSEQLTRLNVEIDSLGWAVEVEQLSPDEIVEPGESQSYLFAITAPGSRFKEIGSNPVLTGRMERDGAWPFGELFRQELVLAHIPPPHITGQPESADIMPGTVVTLRVEAAGSPPLSYQWLRNGIPVSDSDLFFGATSDTLTVSASSYEVAAFYQCIVSNEVGEVVSEPAGITVQYPAPRRGGGRVSPDGPPILDGVRLSGPPQR